MVLVSDEFWDRVIILVDMNCFFAQVEQQDNLFWRNRPVAITNGKLGSTIITCSYEARAYGVKTGMRLKEARQLCPELIQAPSRPHRYVEKSTQIMQSLEKITPDLKIYSVDEAFLDVTKCQTLLGTPEAIGKLVKKTVSDASGLTCSVGGSGDKTTAKYAAKLVKPDGLTIIAPWEAEARLADETVTELSGIAKGIGSFLNKYGVYKCGDMKKLPIGILAQRFGNPGRRIWLMAQGKDPEPITTVVKAPKTIGHGKVMPPGTRDLRTVLIYLQHMAEKVGARLRRHNFQSNHFSIGIKTEEGWLGTQIKIDNTTDDGQVIFELGRQFMQKHWAGQEARQVQITAFNPTECRQHDLFLDNTHQIKREKINQTLDQRLRGQSLGHQMLNLWVNNHLYSLFCNYLGKIITQDLSKFWLYSDSGSLDAHMLSVEDGNNYFYYYDSDAVRFHISGKKRIDLDDLLSIFKSGFLSTYGFEYSVRKRQFIRKIATHSDLVLDEKAIISRALREGKRA